MKIFQLQYDYEHDDKFVFFVIDESTLGFDRYDVEKGEMIYNWNDNIKITFDKTKGSFLSDYIANDLTWFIITDKFKHLLNDYETGLVQYLPIKAFGKEKIDAYLLNICNLVDALNLDNSKYNIYELDDNEKMLSIQKYALTGSNIGKFDIFRLKNDYFSIFVTERLKNAMKKNDITGCDFLEVKVV